MILNKMQLMLKANKITYTINENGLNSLFANRKYTTIKPEWIKELEER